MFLQLCVVLGSLNCQMDGLAVLTSSAVPLPPCRQAPRAGDKAVTLLDTVVIFQAEKRTMMERVPCDH